MNVVYESHDHGGLATMGAVRPIQGSEGHRDSTERERERRSLGFSPMASLEDGVAEMVTR
jgi:hypothetical protein